MSGWMDGVVIGAGVVTGDVRICRHSCGRQWLSGLGIVALRHIVRGWSVLWRPAHPTHFSSNLLSSTSIQYSISILTRRCERTGSMTSIQWCRVTSMHLLNSFLGR